MREANELDRAIAFSVLYIFNGFFRNPAHDYNPRFNIKNIPEAIAHQHGLERN
ncbi:hypothetical protein [aff. Roholtiella sp. LEGE 12411]|uniref:hypothetical protein n=1 Tax=aff. Roholtiella sp. LEGE 12411 TaxID=1828822 RepID=UPI00187F155D|nr:hypothetical protein [aff. Roholtiella sp. LEGE 12411]MBE9038853.1 hypothetical protein [aff. Roholtiella sp. LEGE 12411]